MIHLADGRTLQRRLDARTAPLTTALGVYGMPGFTAYVGLHEIGKPQPGETVVVAAASGPVGATVGQIARLQGARAVGIAGGEAKRVGEIFERLEVQFVYIEVNSFVIVFNHQSYMCYSLFH